MKRGRRWPLVVVVLVAAVITTYASLQLDALHVNGDLYALLGDDDPTVVTFRDIAAVTTGLEELLVVCKTDHLLPALAIDKIIALDEIKANTRAYVEAGRSSLYAFSMVGDPASYVDAGYAVDRVAAVLAALAPDCGMTGTPAYIVETRDRIDADLLRALAIAVVLVTTLFAFVYRIGWLAILVLVPVGLGIDWGLAAYSLIRPELTLLAAAVPTLLIGIGVDHCIHMIQACRYAINQDGRDRDAAVRQAWSRVIKPISVASATTIVTFCVLATAELQGFADFGLAGALISAGVYLACIGLLPVILWLCPQRWLVARSAIGVPMRRLAPWILANARWIIVITLLVTAAAVVSASKLQLLSDVRQLEANDMQSRLLQARIASEYGLSASPLIVLFDNADDAAEFMAADQRPASFSRLVAEPDVRELVQVHIEDDPFIRGNYQRAVADIERHAERLQLGNWQLSGAPAMNARIDQLLFADMRVVIPVAAALVLIVLAIGTRSISLPFVVLLPLVLSLIWVAGAMSALGVAVSVVTAAIVPMVLGIGVDGGVHLLASWRRHDGQLQAVFGETGLAIVVTVLTSIAAFGAFVVAHSPSLLQFGAQAAAALFGCLLVTIGIVPLILQRRHTQAAAKEH